MRRQLIECVANFSEGRNPAVIENIAAAISTAGAAVLHRTMDADHHRSVVTFAGAPESVLSAAVRAVRRAAELIDLTQQRGVHPRLGAADVVPLVPVEGITLEECAALAHRLGEEIWRETGVPVYYYEAAALSPERRKLEDVRRGEFEAIREAVKVHPDSRPDVGGPFLHPTAGAVIVGARKILIAWNVNLATDQVRIAKAIARSIRASSGGFPHVKALGLWLASRNQAQVSMNLTDFEQTPMHVVWQAICDEAATYGVAVAGSEIIGLLPRAALEQAAEAFFRFENFRPESVLESRIELML